MNRLQSELHRLYAPLASAKQADCCVVITDHTDFDYKALLAASKLIVDTRNALKGIDSDKIVRL